VSRIRISRSYSVVLGALIMSLSLASCVVADPDRYYRTVPRCTAMGPEVESCVQKREAQDYVASIRQEIFDAWHLPSGVAPSQKVTLMLRLDEAGAVQCLSLLPDSERILARSVIRAVERVAPFEPMPPNAACLAKRNLKATFTNPLDRQ
jgi:hypothetical protein